MLAFGVISFGFMWVYYLVINKRRREGVDEGKTGGLTEAELLELGDKNPKFIYVT